MEKKEEKMAEEINCDKADEPQEARQVENGGEGGENGCQCEDEQEQAAEEVKKLKEALEAKTKEADEYLNLAKRIQAEFDNFRKRTQKEKEDLVKYGNEQLILAMLPVLDNLERAAAVEVNDANRAIIDGVNMVINQFKKVLSDFNVKEIQAEGKPFDPYKHHAVMQVEDSGCEPNTVVEVLQKGYELNDRVIRPSLVKVAK